MMDRDLLARIADRVDLRQRLEAIHRLTNMAESEGKGNVFLDLIRRESSAGPAGEATPRSRIAPADLSRPRPAIGSVDPDPQQLPTGGLSPAEVRIVNQLESGDSNDQIGATLHLSTNTVKTHLARIGKKWGGGDRAYIVAQGFKRGLLVIPHSPKPLEDEQELVIDEEIEAEIDEEIDIALLTRAVTPVRTEEMKRLGQHWVWMWDRPQPGPGAGGYDPDIPGRWEIRGTGLRL